MYSPFADGVQPHLHLRADRARALIQNRESWLVVDQSRDCKPLLLTETKLVLPCDANVQSS